jgi:transcription elongation factor SPT5
MDAPTPGNFSAPTPGDTGYKFGATPAAAPTPGAWEPATPAPSGEDPGYH